MFLAKGLHVIFKVIKNVFLLMVMATILFIA